MSAKQVARRRRARSVAGGAAVVALLTAGAAGTSAAPAGVVQATRGGEPACCARVIPTPADIGATAGPARGPAPASARASRAAHRSVKVVLPAGVAREKGLQVKTILAARTISAVFPQISDIGGVRADSLKWHPHGLALDVMIPNYQSAEGKALGDSIVTFMLTNGERLGLDHLIWRQMYYPRNGSPRRMADRGGDVANHYNHVHIATVGGGFPTGHEVYLR